MGTQFVGMKDFRQNMAQYTKDAKKKNIRLIVLRKNVPVFEVNPIDEKEYVYLKLKDELAESEEQIKKGESYSQEEIMKEFGLL
jgi:PHD/YefM family antitoxin component YafN of YafNO toxin-antitoxin module